MFNIGKHDGLNYKKEGYEQNMVFDLGYLGYNIDQNYDKWNAHFVWISCQEEIFVQKNYIIFLFGTAQTDGAVQSYPFSLRHRVLT
jgi:hypothetical protein